MVNIFSVFCSYDVYNIFSDARPRESLSQASTVDVVSLDVNLEFWEENFTPWCRHFHEVFIHPQHKSNYVIEQFEVYLLSAKKFYRSCHNESWRGSTFNPPSPSEQKNAISMREFLPRTRPQLKIGGNFVDRVNKKNYELYIQYYR